MTYRTLEPRFAEHSAHQARAAWMLFRHGRYETVLSRIREIRLQGADPTILASLERLERLTRARMNGFSVRRV